MLLSLLRRGIAALSSRSLPAPGPQSGAAPQPGGEAPAGVPAALDASDPPSRRGRLDPALPDASVSTRRSGGANRQSSPGATVPSDDRGRPPCSARSVCRDDGSPRSRHSSAAPSRQTGVAASPTGGFPSLRALLAGLPLDWLLARPCPLCRRLPPVGGSGPGLCAACARRLELPPAGLSGLWPLPWWSSASYAGALRGAVLDQKRHPDATSLTALLTPLCTALEGLDLPRGALLVPIPSWKRQGNPLPGLIADVLARHLGLRRRDLLARSRVVLTQHRLGQRLRQANQVGSFQLRPGERAGHRTPVLLIDDVLTTGATLRHAALCLEQAGWPVLGAACLARTPARGAWLRTP